MVTVYDVRGEELVPAVAEVLESKLKKPKWAEFVKTGVHKERPPETEGWWSLRAASLLRRVYMDGPVGVQRLRRWYGGRQSRGHKPERSKKAGGKIIRLLLQQLEKQGLVKKTEKGRKITPEGQKLLDNLAKQVRGG